MSSFSQMRKPLFWAALACLFLAVLVEVGSAGWVKSTAIQSADSRPGVGITYLALFDGLLVWVVAMMGLSLLIHSATHARIQGIATLIFSILYLILGIVSLIFVFLFLMQMVMLFLAVPFGTIAYIGLYGHFAVEAAAVTLGVVMFLKLAFFALLMMSHQGYLKNKFLLLFIGLSILLTFILTFLQSFPPSFLASITDALSALVAAVVALVMTVVVLLGSLPGIVRAIG